MQQEQYVGIRQWVGNGVYSTTHQKFKIPDKNLRLGSLPSWLQQQKYLHIQKQIVAYFIRLRGQSMRP